MSKIINKKIIFIIIFVVLGLMALRIPFSQIIGAKQSFTLFDFMGPITGMFLGSWLGALSVAMVEIVNFFIKEMTLDTTTFIRFWPMIFAAVYFGTKSKWINIVPLLCIGLFLVHPIGRQVWYYPLTFWLIPVIASLWKNRLSLNALGATFTAHAVGSTAFLYAFNLPAVVWKSLMTIVPLERLTFAAGIFVSYLVINNILNWLAEEQHFAFFKILVNKKLILNKSIFANL